MKRFALLALLIGACDSRPLQECERDRDVYKTGFELCGELNGKMFLSLNKLSFMPLCDLPNAIDHARTVDCNTDNLTRNILKDRLARSFDEKSIRCVDVWFQVYKDSLRPGQVQCDEKDAGL